MKTRLRRWYWSSVRPGGQPLEYTGDPLEKLLGFLIAVVIMAFYLGIVNLILMFGSLSLLAAPGAAYFLSALGVVPVVFYAQYRSRRYVLARTRWRGVRFGLEPGAWGYAAEATRQWLLTLLTLGWWWPRKAFFLEKYRTDRTFFGTARLNQGGTPSDLYPAFAHVYVPGVLMLSAFQILLSDPALQIGDFPPMGWLVSGFALWMVFGMIYYRACTLRYLTDRKFAGGLRLNSRLRPGRFAVVYSVGYGLVSVLSFLPLILLGFGIGIAIAVLGLDDFEAFVESAEALDQVSPWVFTIIGIALYFFVFLSWSILSHTFVTMPIWRHVAETLDVVNADRLYLISQRARDEFEEAEGFAEALDVGAAL